MQPLLKQVFVGPCCYKAVNEHFLSAWLAVPSMSEKQTEKALSSSLTTAVTETSLRVGFLLFLKKMQFLDTAVVRLEAKTGVYQVVVPCLPRCSKSRNLQVTPVNPGFVLPLDDLSWHSCDYPWGSFW